MKNNITDEIIETLKKCQKTIEKQEQYIKLLELKLAMKDYKPPVIVRTLTGTPPCHFHGNIPCYSNPCFWC